MKMEQVALLVGLIASVLAIAAYMRETRHETNTNTVGSGSNIPNVAPVSVVINRGAGATGPGMPPQLPQYQGGGGQCGCGSGFGDFAVPRLNPTFGYAQRTLPYEPAPQVRPRLDNTIGNGASA